MNPAPGEARRPFSPWVLGGAILAAVWLLWERFNATPPRSGLQPPGDLIQYYLPLAEQAAGRLAAGELPLWNPHACSGIPLLATLQVGVFYPASWLAQALPAERALEASMLLQCGLGGGFMAAWLRSWGRSAPAAATGGVLFVFACLLGETSWPPVVSTLIWLPWLLLCVEKLVSAWRWRWWAGLALGTGLQLLAGFPQLSVYTFYAVGPYAAARLLDQRHKQPPGPVLATAAGLLAAVLLGSGLAAIQLVPTAELVSHSARGVETLERGQIEYLPGQLTARGVLANALDPRPKNTAFDYMDGAGYLGIPTLLLIAGAVLAGPRRGRLWLLLGAAGLALALSDGFGDGLRGRLYELYRALPTESPFRTPQRLRVLYLFVLIGVAAWGFDRLTAPGSLDRRRARLVGLGVALSAALVSVVGGVAVTWRAAGALALLGGAAAGSRRPLLRTGCRLGLFALVVADVALATGEYGSLRSFDGWSRVFHARGHVVLDGAASVALEQRAGFDRVEILGLEPMMAAEPAHGVQRISCFEDLFPEAWWELSRQVSPRPISSAILWNVDPERHPTLYDVTSVRWLVLRRDRDGPRTPARVAYSQRELLQIHREHDRPLPAAPEKVGYELVENRDALPRAFWIDRFSVVSAERARKAVARGSVDFRQRVLLDREPGFPEPPGDATMLRPARIVRYAPERVEIEVEAPGPGVLVLTDTHYPGWQALVDGREAEILRANGLHRAVALEPGRHLVVFRYRPRSLRLGAALSALCLAVVAGIPLVASGRWRHRPGKAEGRAAGERSEP